MPNGPSSPSNSCKSNFLRNRSHSPGPGEEVLAPEIYGRPPCFLSTFPLARKSRAVTNTQRVRGAPWPQEGLGGRCEPVALLSRNLLRRQPRKRAPCRLDERIPLAVGLRLCTPRFANGDFHPGCSEGVLLDICKMEHLSGDTGSSQEARWAMSPSLEQEFSCPCDTARGRPGRGRGGESDPVLCPRRPRLGRPGRAGARGTEGPQTLTLRPSPMRPFLSFCVWVGSIF